MVWWRISSIYMGAGNLLLMKCSQTLSSWIKKPSLFCFCKFLCLLYLRICFCLKRAKPCLEFTIKSTFNQYSMRSFQRALVGFNNFWINFIFRKFNWVSKMSKECLSVWEDWFFLLFRRKLYILFWISFLIYLGIVHIWTMYQSLDKSWFITIFLPLKESLTLFQIWSFLLNFHLFCPNCSYREKNLQN